jgi:hypothetical protein
MKKHTLKMIPFISVCLVCLALGLLGVSRQSLRVGKPFKWQAAEGRVVVTRLYPERTILKNGLTTEDIVLEIDGLSVRRGEVVINH